MFLIAVNFQRVVAHNVGAVCYSRSYSCSQKLLQTAWYTRTCTSQPIKWNPAYCTFCLLHYVW